MSEYTQGVCHDGAAILKDGQRMTIEEILAILRSQQARIEELERIEEIHHQQYRAEQAKNTKLVELLAAIHMRIYPRLRAGPDGKTYRFTAPNPHDYLQALADCIRAIPDALAKSCTHANYSFAQHGRVCPCGKVMTDFGD